MSVLDRFRREIRSAQTELSTAIERRDPTGSTRNTQGVGATGTMVAEWNADQAIQLAFYSNVFVYAAVTRCAQAISGLPFRAGANPEKPDIFKPPNRSRLAYLLGPPPGGPAPKVSPRRLWAWSIANYLVTGKFAWELEGTKPQGQGDIVHLWPLISARLEPKPSDGGTDWFKGFSYKPNSLKDPTPFTPDQVFYVWRPSLHDWRQPESPLQAARLDISVAVMQDRYDYAFLRNDARPAAMVVHEAFALEQEKEAFKRRFRGEFRGPENAGKVMFVEASGDHPGGVSAAIDVKTLGLSQKDAQFIQRYEKKIQAICAALGTPMSIISDASQRTYDNANVEHRNWWEGTLQNLAFEMSDEINMSLAPRLGDDIGWWDFSDVKALQSDSRILALGALLKDVVGPGKPIATSEFRAELGLPDKRPDDLPGEVPPSPPVVTPPTEPVPLANEPVPTGGGGGAPPPPVAPPPAAPGRRSPRTREQREVEWRKADQQATSMEPAFNRAVTGLFERQRKSVMNRLGGKRGRQLVKTETRAVAADDLFDPEYWAGETTSTVTPLYDSIMAMASNKMGDTLGVRFDISDPKAVEFIEARAKQLAGQISDTTYQSIKDAIASGVEAGEGIPEIADRIQGVFDEATGSRATMIARTETISAYNGSSDTIANLLGTDIVAGEEWIATGDARCRPEHLDADGQQIVPDGTFNVGGEDLSYPGDPSGSPGNTVNCRCTVGLLTPDMMRAKAVPETRDGNGHGRLESLRDTLVWDALARS